MSLSILLLEDDEMLGETLASLLEMEGYAVVWVKRGNDVLDLTFDTRYDLYIFDIGVPDIDGLELLASLRDGEDDTPAIFISARTDIASIMRGFESGAYDYLKKPFFPEELLVRIRARFQPKHGAIECGAWQYDPVKRVLRQDGKLVPLGEVQQTLLHLFMTNIGRVIDKSDLLECLNQPSDSALRVAINKLKQTTNLPIKNIRGLGYMLETC
ncbi:response regulator transcription factor [Hydrogenimonas sp.]|uniref:response regulator transcription factor n=1 Tax=Hydrogenimonas sp. TaxID=2231112 RepID=UPI0026173FFF|nr:response regulator transcription factor [Hydrogenimonas sp.]